MQNNFQRPHMRRERATYILWRIQSELAEVKRQLIVNEDKGLARTADEFYEEIQDFLDTINTQIPEEIRTWLSHREEEIKKFQETPIDQIAYQVRVLDQRYG